jgi:uncharacterized protein YkwD
MNKRTASFAVIPICFFFACIGEPEQSDELGDWEGADNEEARALLEELNELDDEDLDLLEELVVSDQDGLTEKACLDRRSAQKCARLKRKGLCSYRIVKRECCATCRGSDDHDNGQSESDDSLTGRSAEWLRWTNEFRRGNGIPNALSWDRRLADAAKDWGQHIVDTMSCRLPSNPNSSHDPNRGGNVGENITSRTGGWSRTDAPVINLVNNRFGTSPLHKKAMLWNSDNRMGCAQAYNAERQCRVYVCRYAP